MDKPIDFWTNTFAKLGLKLRKLRGKRAELKHRAMRLEQLQDRRMLAIDLFSTADCIGDASYLENSEVASADYGTAGVAADELFIGVDLENGSEEGLAPAASDGQNGRSPVVLEVRIEDDRFVVVYEVDETAGPFDIRVYQTDGESGELQVVAECRVEDADDLTPGRHELSVPLESPSSPAEETSDDEDAEEGEDEASDDSANAAAVAAEASGGSADSDTSGQTAPSAAERSQLQEMLKATEASNSDVEYLIVVADTVSQPVVFLLDQSGPTSVVTHLELPARKLAVAESSETEPQAGNDCVEAEAASEIDVQEVSSDGAKKVTGVSVDSMAVDSSAPMVLMDLDGFGSGSGSGSG